MALNNNYNTNGLDAQVAVEDLPITFKVKYIGSEIAKGLWGIKYTRRPVDLMVAAAKNLPANRSLPICDLKVSINGVSMETISPRNILNSCSYPIDTISYGVQDLVYTRVFAMIVVKDDSNSQPFEVHAFVCDSRAIARRLTYALAAAFQDYSRRVKQNADKRAVNDPITPTRQRFAIELRSPDDYGAEDANETEA